MHAILPRCDATHIRISSHVTAESSIGLHATRLDGGRPPSLPVAGPLEVSMAKYQSYLEPNPDLDAFRLDYEPRDGLGLVFVCPYAVVSDESGQMYQLMRGVQGYDKNKTINYGIYDVNDDLDSSGSLLYPYDEVPALEEFWVAEDEDAVSFVGETYRLDFGPDTYRWSDASGRVELEGDKLGQACSFWVPEQEGFEHPQLLRSHTAKVTGDIKGKPVEGLFMVDYIYSNPELMFLEMGMMTSLHNIWLNWMVEYEDGTYEGGFAWRGQPGDDFAAACHIRDGESTARSDAVIETERTDRGTFEHVRLSVGNEVTVEMPQHGAQDWPLHTIGTVSSTSRDKEIARSWNWTENIPLNFEDFVNYREAAEKLYGTPPSFEAVMADAKIENNRLVFPDR